MLLAPSEAGGMTAALQAAGIPTKTLRMNPDRTQAIGPALQALCSKDGELKVRVFVAASQALGYISPGTILQAALHPEQQRKHLLSVLCACELCACFAMYQSKLIAAWC